MRNSYVVGYDLGGPNRDYEELIEAIKSYPAYAHPLESMWIVKSSDSAEDIRDNLKSYIDSNDKLLVIQIDTDSVNWGTNFSDNHTEWLHDNL